jgi:hypothetical protein
MKTTLTNSYLNLSAYEERRSNDIGLHENAIDERYFPCVKADRQKDAEDRVKLGNGFCSIKNDCNYFTKNGRNYFIKNGRNYFIKNGRNYFTKNGRNYFIKNGHPLPFYTFEF